jgi:carboxylesterase
MKKTNGSFFLQRGSRGVLLIHGFTGSPHDLRHMGERLHEAGYTVTAPLLAGHGGDLEEFGQASCTDWYESARRAYDDLRRQCDSIFVAGLSLGGLLALRLGYLYGNQINAVCCFAAPLFFSDPQARFLLPLIQYSPARYFIRYTKFESQDIADEKNASPRPDWTKIPLQSVYQLSRMMRMSRKYLTAIKNPVLVAQSINDHRTSIKSADYIFDNIGSAIKQKLILQKSYHLITIDYEKDVLADEVISFFNKF